VAHVEVPTALEKQMKVVVKSMKMHAAHDRLPGKPHYHARLATLEAEESLNEDEYRHAQSVHRAAGSAKHPVGAHALAASGGSGHFGPSLALP
jgi:hypothetical protein